MNEYELIQTIAVENETITAQYQFWMATTFAAVIAAHTAGNKISSIVRVCLAILYIAACAVFYFRYNVAVINIREILMMLNEQGSFYAREPQIGIITFIRHFVLIGGSLLATVLIIKPDFGIKKG